MSGRGGTQGLLLLLLVLSTSGRENVKELKLSRRLGGRRGLLSLLLEKSFLEEVQKG